MNINIYENEAERLKQEIGAIRCIFSEKDEMVVNKELESWLEQEVSNEGSHDDLRFRVLLGDRKFYSMPLYLEITLDPDNNYKSGLKKVSIVATKEWDGDNKRPFFLSESQTKYIEDVGINAFIPNMECIYDQVIASREATEDIVRDIPCEVLNSSLDSEMQSISSESESESSVLEQEEMIKYVWNTSGTSGTIKWGQRACYSHHIRSKIKRRLIVEWAKELSLGGYCKIGYPGIIIVEGLEDCCLEYTRRLQRLRWKHFIVRGEIIKDVSIDKNCTINLDTINSLRILPNTMIELPSDGTKILARICEDLGIKDLFLTTMKIYSK